MGFFARLILAFRVFFRVLFNSSVAERVSRALVGEAPSKPATLEPPKPVVKKEPPTPKPPARSEALNLLATLQREARFVDFIQEQLGSYSDAQIGAAVRDVHRQCAEVLGRIFGLRPLVEAAEGAEMDVPVGFEPARFRLVGNVTGQPPYRGRLCHHGWEASKVELPEWTGGAAAARVVAPAEVELK